MPRKYDTSVIPCSKCSHGTMSDKAYRAQPVPRANRERRQGDTGEVVCRRCHRQANPGNYRRPKLTDNPDRQLNTVKRELVLTDWNWLHETAQLTQDMPLQRRIQLAAPRIGMSVTALEKALARAGIRNPQEPSVHRAVVREHRPGYQCVECVKRHHQVDCAEADVRQATNLLNADPDSPQRAERLTRAREVLADERAWLDLHLEDAHAEDVAA